jgi:hypothetical protein
LIIFNTSAAEAIVLSWTDRLVYGRNERHASAESVPQPKVFASAESVPQPKVFIFQLVKSNEGMCETRLCTKMMRRVFAPAPVWCGRGGKPALLTHFAGCKPTELAVLRPAISKG